MISQFSGLIGNILERRDLRLLQHVVGIDVSAQPRVNRGGNYGAQHRVVMHDQPLNGPAGPDLTISGWI